MSIQLDPNLPHLVFETETDYAHYQVWDIMYDGRPARVLYSGQRQTAQSGIAIDDNHDLLFDYNQRFYELICGLLPRRVLLIGGGSYTLPMALLAVLPSLEIDVVEVDDQLLGIAQQYFGLKADPRLQIIHGDGRQYLDQTTERYDVIIVDAFSQDETPSSLTDAAAARAIKRVLRPDGLVAVNVIAAYHGRRGEGLAQRRAALASCFDSVSVFPASRDLSLWLAQNLLLVAQKSPGRNLDRLLRYPALGTEPAVDLKRDFGQS